MDKSKNIFYHIDKTTLFLYLFLVFFGVISINAVNEDKAIKQLIFLCISLVAALFIMNKDRAFFEKWSGLIYVCSVLLLAGLFTPLGKEINGARAWYQFGPISLQPTEFAKLGVGLMVGNYLSNPSLDKKSIQTLITCFIIIGIPLLLIKLQPDDGSVLVFSSFFVGLLVHGIFFIKQMIVLGVAFLTLFIIGISSTDYIAYLIENPLVLIVSILVFIFICFIVLKFIFYIQQPLYYAIAISAMFFCVGVIFGSDYIFGKLKPHQKDRIEILFLDDTDKKVRNEKNGYNLFTAKSCIASGELIGKGYKKGDITQGKIVPEQHTDYIFTTIGEEWGFIGSSIIVLAYGMFLIRLYLLSARQRNIFSSYLGFSIASVFTIHFIINIAMVLGIFPTIGIPLPFFSYGGSSLLGFSIMFFILLRLDTDRSITHL